MQETALISVIIPTIGRDSLGRAIDSALMQEIPGGLAEVVVVDDSGHGLETAAAVLSDPRIAVVTTNKRRQSVARNVGAAVAHGQYLLFLDDDDHLMPGALASLLAILLERSGLVLAYGGVLFVDGADKVLGTLNLGISGNCASPMMAGAFIPPGSALIDTDAFFAVGGFNPTMTTSEDIDLFRKLAMQGDFGNSSSDQLKVVRGEGWLSSQDYGPAVSLLRRSREHILDQRHAFTRLTRSARSPYWHGRNAKAYLASVYWNVRRGRLMRAVSRTIGAIGAALHAGTALFRGAFWQALRDSQVPQTSQRCLQDRQIETSR